MGKLKSAWDRIDPKVALVGGIIVITTNLGTCQLSKPDAAVEPAPEVVEMVEPEATPEVEAEPAPEPEPEPEATPEGE